MKIVSWMRRGTALIAFAAVVATASSAVAQSNPKLQSSRTKYKVRVETNVPGASIYLDDKKYGVVGKSPWDTGLISGYWTIIVEAKGYEPASKTVRVKRVRSRQVFTLTMTKKPEPPIIEVRADADKNAFGASVSVDGQLQGTVPVTIKLSDGRHLVEVTKQDFEKFTQWVEVKEGDRLAVQPMLKPIVKQKFGKIFVEADVPDAQVYIDGNKHPDNTPTVIDKVLIGPHIVEVRKDPAIPWKQTVQVDEDKPVKVRAELKATIGGPTGKVRVLANVENARVYVDGREMGGVPMDIADLKPGEHVIEVKATGFLPSEKRITVGAGDAQIHKFELQPEPTSATAKLKVVSRVPEATVYLDGKNIGMVPQEIDVAAGDHFVVVEKEGFTKFEKKIRIELGKPVTISAELKAVGGINIVSTPAGAEVMIDGVPTGKVTPYKTSEIDVGQHIITLRYPNYYNYEKTHEVKGGQMEVIQAKLERIDTGPTPGELAREQKGLTSFGARVLPRGRTTVDAYVGYPYFSGLRFTVGAGKLGGRPFDFGVSFRSYLSRTEILATGRLNLADRDPFSAGLFFTTGGGSNFVDDSGRNGFVADLGVAASLSGLGAVTITGQAFLDIWSDRHCPSYDTNTMTFEDGFTPLEICEKIADGSLETDDPTKFKRVQDLVGDGADDAFSRDVGARLMIGVTVEISIRQRWNIWGQFEGAPFQVERATYVDEFSPWLFSEDIGTYFRLGTTYKF